MEAAETTGTFLLLRSWMSVSPHPLPPSWYRAVFGGRLAELLLIGIGIASEEYDAHEYLDGREEEEQEGRDVGSKA